MRKSFQSFVFFLGSMLYVIQVAHGQVTSEPEPAVPVIQQGASGKSTTKLSTDLDQLYQSFQADARRSSGEKQVEKAQINKYIQVEGDMVLVNITIKSDSKSARAELENMGVIVDRIYGRMVSAKVPIRSIPQLETVNSIKFARPAYKPMHRSRSINIERQLKTHFNAATPVKSQGDTAQWSDIARQKYGVNGKGVKVGILSDSYDAYGDADSGVIAGELPGPGNPYSFTKPVQVLRDYYGFDAIDEGRGMAEIVHDVAPGAELAFYSAYSTQIDFALGILRLADAGCKVIVDDIYYAEEPFFQDGIIAQAVDIVAKSGVSYFSAAGNDSRRSYESDYRPSNVSPLGPGRGTAHNFNAPGDVPRYALPIFIPPGGVTVLSFQWDQPFYSLGGDGADTDMNIYLVNAQGVIVDSSTARNIGDDPSEFLFYFNNSVSTTFFVYIVKKEGPNPTRLKYIDFGNSLFFSNVAVPGILAPTIVGHPKAEGAIAVAAAPFLWTPRYGLDTPRIEGFSSLGGVANYFDKQGNRIAPEIRKKPEITSVDGANTSFFSTDSNIDSDTFPNFFGTSASAPHAAAVGALMIEAQKLNTITPGQIKGILSTNTVDMDNIYTPGFDVGFDYLTGTGLIKADAAVKVVKFPNVYVKSLDLIPVCSSNPGSVRNWKVINPNPFEVQARYFLTGLPLQSSNLVVPPGETTFSTRTLYLFNRPVSNVVLLEWEDNFGFARFDLATSNSTVCNSNLVLSEIDRAPDNAAAEVNSKVNIAEVFPNPSSGNFRLYLSLTDQQKTELQLFGMDGKLLYKNVVSGNGIVNIDATRYKPGVYILKVQQGDFNKTLRLIRN